MSKNPNDKFLLLITESLIPLLKLKILLPQRMLEMVTTALIKDV
jgi:hypothetical protein